jgi:hypothetical protein
MKALCKSYLLSVVALVLFFAASIPSQATQHRDPILPQEAAQQSNAADSARARTTTKKSPNPGTAAKSKKQANKNAASSSKNSSDSKNHSGQ